MLQFIVSPWIGWMSDRFGRKQVLFVTMAGNLVSTLLWVFARTFPVFILSRTVGGLFEGNVQLSLAMIADVTTEEERSRGMALVGLAFSLGFTLGPPLGAYFANLRIPQWLSDLSPWPIYPYSGAAMLAAGLIMIECVYLRGVEETKGWRERLKLVDGKKAEANGVGNGHAVNGNGLSTVNVKKPKIRTKAQKKRLLYVMSALHWTYLLIFSGMEFTVPFLTFDRFSYTHTSQGLLFSFIGLLSSLVQGGYVRRHARRVGERTVILQGLCACCIGLGILGATKSETGLYAGSAFLAFASGTVVNVMNSVVSQACSAGPSSGGSYTGPGASEVAEAVEDGGAVLGKFRSAGQLGRALGPLLACGLYWSVGGELAYGVAATAMAGLLMTEPSSNGTPGPINNSSSSYPPSSPRPARFPVHWIFVTLLACLCLMAVNAIRLDRSGVLDTMPKLRDWAADEPGEEGPELDEIVLGDELATMENWPAPAPETVSYDDVLPAVADISEGQAEETGEQEHELRVERFVIYADDEEEEEEQGQQVAQGEEGSGEPQILVVTSVVTETLTVFEDEQG
ncbi:hypothetical protein HDU93_010023 [Gonapodya sp. JEL0774]|nr:hypothetical protein HDU93_010023 [Gonapodya sp. JEL0774]